MSTLSHHIACKWLLAKTPTQMALEDLRLPVSDARFERAMQMAAKYMGGKYRNGNIRFPYRFKDRTFPQEITVLYRKLPCGYLTNQSDGEACVSFDVFPNVGGDPRRSKIYRSFPAGLKNSKVQFGKFLGWLRIVGDAIRRYVAQTEAGQTPQFAKIAMSLPVYIGVFLTPSSRQQLLRDFPPVFPNVFADHVTLIFKPKETDLAKFDLGSIVRLKVVGYAQDQKGSAVLVDLPSEIEEKPGQKPHITISTAQGIKPFYSNKLISKPGNIERVSPKTYQGILDGFPRSRNASAESVTERWLYSKIKV